LYYNRFRYYSPEEESYISQDPIRIHGGKLNLYSYVHDPNEWVDILGLQQDYTFDLPKNPKALEDAGWHDITHPDMRANTTSKEYHNPETGQRVRFDEGKVGAHGWEGKDHYHVHNPHSTGKGDFYLDVHGKPTNKGSNASHISPH